MEGTDTVPKCLVNSIYKSQCSVPQNENELCLQPSRRFPMTYTKPYKKPIIKIESDTTYGLSYTKFDCVSNAINYGIHEKAVADKPGKFDFGTIYKDSYEALKEKVRKPIIPKSCLSINGSYDMLTTHMKSYVNPGYIKTKSYKPHRGKIHHCVSMENKTIMKESYQNFGLPIEIKRPIKREFWQTKFKTDYETTNHLSYQSIPLSNTNSCLTHYRPSISSQIEKDTIYTTSYGIPCRLIKNTINST